MADADGGFSAADMETNGSDTEWLLVCEPKPPSADSLGSPSGRRNADGIPRRAVSQKLLQRGMKAMSLRGRSSSELNIPSIVSRRPTLQNMNPTPPKNTLAAKQPAYRRTSFTVAPFNTGVGENPSPPMQKRSSNVSNPSSEDHSNVVKERRLSIEKTRQEMQRCSFERNEVHREHVRKAGSERQLTKLLSADAEKREQQWLSLIQMIKSVSCVSTILQERRAVNVLRLTFFPIIFRFANLRKRRLARKELIASRVSEMTPPTAASLKNVSFFAKWPSKVLARLVEGVEPSCYERGQFVCLEGEPGDKMYIIDKGEMDILVREKDQRKKSRRAGICVATISAATQPYVGEFAVICTEPRFASALCVTDVNVWALKSEFVKSQLQELPSKVIRDLEQMAAQRRTSKLEKLYPVRAVALANASPIFNVFDNVLLKELISKFKPYVIRSSDTLIFEEGSASERLYVVATGDIKLTRSIDGSTSVYSAGSVIGEAELLYVEKRAYTARTIGCADLWILDKSDLMQFLLTHPELFVAAKMIAGKMRHQQALSFNGSTPWATDSVLSKHLPSRFLRKIPSLLYPKVVGRADTVVSTGDDFEGVICISAGCIEDTKSKQQYRSGSLIGVPEMLTMQPRWSVTLVADDRTDVWILPKARVFEELNAHFRETLARLTSDTVQERLRRAYGQPFQPSNVVQKTSGHQRREVLSQRLSILNPSPSFRGAAGDLSPTTQFGTPKSQLMLPSPYSISPSTNAAGSYAAATAAATVERPLSTDMPLSRGISRTFSRSLSINRTTSQNNAQNISLPAVDTAYEKQPLLAELMDQCY